MVAIGEVGLVERSGEQANRGAARRRRERTASWLGIDPTLEKRQRKGTCTTYTCTTYTCTLSFQEGLYAEYLLITVMDLAPPQVHVHRGACA